MGFLDGRCNGRKICLEAQSVLTQLQLARKAGISAPRLCQWERGEIELEPDQVVRIAEVLHKHLCSAPVFECATELAKALTPLNDEPSR